MTADRDLRFPYVPAPTAVGTASPRRATALTPARRHLVDLMRGIRYGRIENLRIEAGQPLIRPGQAVVQEIKFGSDDSSRPSSDLNDYLLKRQVVELFEFMDSAGDGLVHTLEIKGGLPFKVEAEKRI